MIQSATKDDTLSAIDIIGTSPFEFQLTGSRYFGTAKNGSDFDFFTKEVEGVEIFLAQNGFVNQPNDYRNDPHTVRVYKKGEVHVQIVNRFQLKLAAQFALTPILVNNWDKDTLKVLWKMMLDTLARYIKEPEYGTFPRAASRPVA